MKSAWFAVFAVSCIQFFSVMSNPVFYPVFYPVVRGRRWIPDRFSNEDFGVDSSGSSQNPSFDSGNNRYLSYFWPDYSNVGSSGGDYSGMLYRTSDNTNHGSMDPVQQLHGVQAYSYAQMLRPYGYYGRTLHEMQGETATDEDTDVGGRALANLGLIRSDLQPGAALLNQQPLIFLVPTQVSEPQPLAASGIDGRKHNVLKLKKNPSVSGHHAAHDSNGEQENKAHDGKVKSSHHLVTSVQRLTPSEKTKKKSSNKQQVERIKNVTKLDSNHQTNEDTEETLEKTPDSDKKKENFRTHGDGEQTSTESSMEVRNQNVEVEQTTEDGPSTETPLVLDNEAVLVEDVEDSNSNSKNAEEDEDDSLPENGKEAEKMKGRSYGDPISNPYESGNYGGSPLPPNLVYSGILPPLPLRPEIPTPYYRSPSQYPLPIYGYPPAVSDSHVPIYNLAPLPPQQYPFPYGQALPMPPSIFPPNGYMPLSEPFVLNPNMAPNNHPGNYAPQPRRATRKITYNWVQPKHVSG